MYSTRQSFIVLSFIEARIADYFAVGNLEEKIVGRRLFEIETHDLFEFDDRKRGVEGVQLADLNVRPVQVIRVIRQFGQAPVPHLLPVFNRIVGGPNHAVQWAALLARKAHADIDERYPLRNQQVEDAHPRRSLVDAHEGEGDAVEFLNARRVDELCLDRQTVPEVLVPSFVQVGLGAVEFEEIEVCPVNETRCARGTRQGRKPGPP